MATPKAATPRVKTSKRADKSSLNYMNSEMPVIDQAGNVNMNILLTPEIELDGTGVINLDRLPSEILIKILSYLDASALFTISHVNKLFYQLANDNALWNKLYIAELGKNKKKRKPKCMDELLLKVATVEVHDRAAGYWKWLHFKTVATYDKDKLKSHLGVISRHTGLPNQTERVLRNLHVTWELTVSDKSGHEGTYEPSWSQFTGTSVTLCWSGGGGLPDYEQISTLHLHGVRRVALKCPGLKKPGWRSLMAKLDVQTLTESAQVIGQDTLVELKLLQPGVIVGVWRDQCSVAFIMFTLHFHKLVERSTQGSSVSPYVVPIIKPPFDDTDPDYGLHGYQLHIVLHDTACEIVSGSFPQLFCRRTKSPIQTGSKKASFLRPSTSSSLSSCTLSSAFAPPSQISDGLIQLTAISRTTSSQQTPLSGSITLPWRCEALQGSVKNCCIMNLTLLDEFRKPFWCVGSPVSMEPEKTPVSYDYDGEHFLIHYQDSDGQLEMEFVWMKEQKQFVLISLVVYVTVGKVNQHFSRDY